MKLENGNECLAKLHVTNDVSGLLLSYQHESELAFTFALIMSECGPFWKSTRKYCMFRVGRTQETSAFYMSMVTKKYVLMKSELNRI